MNQPYATRLCVSRPISDQPRNVIFPLGRPDRLVNALMQPSSHHLISFQLLSTLPKRLKIYFPISLCLSVTSLSTALLSRFGVRLNQYASFVTQFAMYIRSVQDIMCLNIATGTIASDSIRCMYLDYVTVNNAQCHITRPMTTGYDGINIISIFSG